MSPTPASRLLAGVAAWIALAATAVGFPRLWPAVAAAGGALLLLALWDRRALRRSPPPEIARRVPDRAFQGRPLELELELRNRSEHPVSMDVFEEVPRDLASPEPAWRGVRLGPRESRRLAVPLRPTVRGDRPLGQPVALEDSQLGLWRRRLLGPAGQQLCVSPDTSRLLRTDALDPRRMLAMLGVRPARQRGQGMEFESLRDYVPGDDPRRLDWAASARRGRPVVRLHQHERNHCVLIAIDASRLMAARIGDRTKLDFAIDAALTLGYAALLAGDRVGMALFDRELRGFVAPRRRRRDLGEFVELLRPAQPRRVEADFQALAGAVAARQRQRALVVLVTDFVEADALNFTAPLEMLGRRHRVLLVAMRDRVFQELSASPPAGIDPRLGLYRRIVLDDLLHERELALARLRRQGLHTLDLPPESITAAVLNRYLELRQAL